MDRIINFSAGPAVMPVSVLEEAKDNLLSLGDTGIGILEHSHRGKAFTAVRDNAESLCRQVGGIPDDYEVLFVQGGASSQFFTIPMNFLGPDEWADYINTGSWSKKAIKEAKAFGHVNVAASSEDADFTRIPEYLELSENPAYVHFTSNNTIFGTQFANEPDIPEGVPLICDASSDIYSRPIDVSRYGMIYAGGQKNLGPSGLVLVILERELMKRGNANIPSMLQYRTHAESKSLYNTPPTFGIYLMGLMFKWILEQGGLEAVERRNEDKANRLYQYLDQSHMFSATAQVGSRSKMNVTFVTGKGDLDAKFISGATERGMDGLKGHRSVGGMRASIYNAFPVEGVDALVEYMREFESENS